MNIDKIEDNKFRISWPVVSGSFGKDEPIDFKEGDSFISEGKTYTAKQVSAITLPGTIVAYEVLT